MIHVPRPALATAVPDQTVRDGLATRQKIAASWKATDKETTSRWNSFTRGTGSNRGVGPVVCSAVRGFCQEKCAYCEAPKAGSIDHVWPKALYPKKMFDWENLLAACRDCNSEKRSGFPLVGGKPVLIDPTRDEPLQHFRWNHLTGECEYAPTDARAVATYEAFAMDRLAGERIHKLKVFRAFLSLATRQRPVDDELRERLRAELDVGRPYLCVIRSYLLYPPDPQEELLIKAAVAAVPDILTWVAPWLRPPAGAAWPP